MSKTALLTDGQYNAEANITLAPKKVFAAMIKKQAFLLFTAFIIGYNYLHARDIFLQYSFARNDSASLTVTLSFNGNKTGRMSINLPDTWAGQAELYNAITDLTSVSSQTTIKATQKPSQFLIEYKPGSTVKIKYILRKEWQGPLQYPFYFHPVIEKDFFYFEGYSGLIYPEISDSSKIECSLSFNNLKPGEFVGTSYFSGKSSANFITTLNDLRNSIFCAGNYRYKEIVKHNNKIVIALSGKFIFDDEAVFTKLSDIISAEKKFWNDFTTPYFFSVLLPMDDQGNSGGTAHHNSFSLFQSKNLKLEQGLTYLISHEYFHNWIGQGLKMPEPEELNKWFQEGFTDYYSYKILKLLNFYSEAEYTNKLNQIIRDYYSSDYSETPNEELIGNYWKDPALKQLSYQRGLIIAFLLEGYFQKIKKGTLDDLMKELYNSSKPRMIFSKKLFDETVIKYANSDLLNLINNVNNGKNNDLSDVLKQSSNYIIKDLTLDKKFDLGFNLPESSNDKKIVGLKSNSNAALAGLREGMEITGSFSIWNNNTEKPARVQVVIGGQKKWIEYIPVREVNIRVPQIVL
jgi:predicted metalloprotease with PDZ domain